MGVWLLKQRENLQSLQPHSSMSTAAYQAKASVACQAKASVRGGAGYVIYNSQRADEFPRGIRIIGLGNLFQDRKSGRTRINAVGSTSFSHAGPKFVNCIRHLAMGRIVCTRKMGRIVCTLTGKNARCQAPRIFPRNNPFIRRNNPFRPSGQVTRWATPPTNRGG